MYRKILFATDFSESARQALELAAGLARAFGSKIHAIHVTPMFDPEPEESEKRLKDHVARFDDVVAERRLVRAVSPELGVVHEARDGGFDLIVIGTHGYSGMKHVLLGSTAERIVQFAGCPVLTCRQHGHEFAHP
jgi:nucleotide-binding universal stress UspA family protein